jgi:multiple sugar transport system substrate-binding protein
VDFSIAALARDYDLIILDHPSIGEAAEHGLVLPLDGLLEERVLADQAANSVGASHPSYTWQGRHWALAVDAATPVASWRPDLLQHHGLNVPQDWAELMELVRAGLVALPAIPVDSLMMLYMLWLDEGMEPLTGGLDSCAAALESARSLVQASGPANLRRNPIQTYEAMTNTDAIAYCPFGYGYSNYARPDYVRNRLAFGNLVTRNRRLRSTLGGAGVAISARCRHVAEAARYAAFMASADIQAGLFVTSGGQPGHRAAWLSAEANRATSGFFRDTLQSLDEAWLRPRWPGYIEFQDRAGLIAHRCLAGDLPVQQAASELLVLHAARVGTTHAG